MIPEVTSQIIDLIGCKTGRYPTASGKSGIGIEEILTAIIDRIPAPTGNTGSATLQSPDLRQRIQFSGALLFISGFQWHIKEER